MLPWHFLLSIRIKTLFTSHVRVDFRLKQGRLYNLDTLRVARGLARALIKQGFPRIWVRAVMQISL